MVLDNLLGGALNSIGMLPVEHNGQKAGRCSMIGVGSINK
jgi:hypothetical protein